MLPKTWAAACGVLLMSVFSDAVAQVATGSAMPPVGAGLPDGRPVDIRGLHTGMPGAAALSLLREHYKAQPVKLNIRSMTLLNSKTEFVAYAMNSNFSGDTYDYLGAAFTSNASGNQVVSIMSHAGYGAGKERSTAETLAAIKQKYGEPSAVTETQFTLLLRYGYKNGQLVKANNPCAGLTGMSELSLRNRDVIQLDEWRTMMGRSARSDGTMAPSDPAQGCSAAMYITIVYGLHPKQPNVNSISEIRFVFFDAERFRAATLRDAEFVKDQGAIERQTAPGGSGASKL